MSRSYSVSKIDGYGRCPKQYWFRNVARMPEPPRSNMLLGTAVHAGVEAFVRNILDTGEVSILLAGKAAEAAWDREVKKVGAEKIEWASDKRSKWTDTAQACRRDARAMAELWATEVGQHDSWEAAELSLSLPLDGAEGPRLTGRLDLKLADGGIDEIKTSRQAWAEGADELSAQAAAYPLMAGRGEGSGQVRFDVVIRHTRKAGTEYEVQRLGPIEITARRQADYLDDARQTVAGIEAGLFPRRVSAMNCNGCAFRATCL